MPFLSDNIVSEGYLSGQTLNVEYATITNLNVLSVTGVSSTDYYVTGGTYSNGTLTLDRQNGSVVINGFSTGGTGTGIDTYVTAFTYNNNVFTISQNQGQPNLTATIPNFITGFTDTFVTGFTYNNNVLTLSQNRGQPNLTATLPMDIYITGGTLNRSTDTIILSRQGGNVNITGVTDTFLTGGTFNSITRVLTLSQNEGVPNFNITGITDTFVTGITYNNANLLLLNRNNGQPNLTTSIDTFTALTVNGLTTTNTLRLTTSPVSGYILTSDSQGNAVWQASPAPASGATKLDMQGVSGDTTVTSTNNSSTWVDIGDMTVIAKNLGSSATTYQISFSCNAALSSNTGVGNIRLVLNGNLIPGSTRTRANTTQIANLTFSVGTQGSIRGVQNGDIIKAQFNSPTGQMTVTNRSMSVMGVLTINTV